jgi:hypothetical protein
MLPKDMAFYSPIASRLPKLGDCQRQEIVALMLQTNTLFMRMLSASEHRGVHTDRHMLVEDYSISPWFMRRAIFC